MVDYNNDIKRWIAKINDFNSKNFDESELQVLPSPSSSSVETESQPPSPSVGMESQPSSLSVGTASKLPDTLTIPPAFAAKTSSRLGFCKRFVESNPNR